MAEVFLFAAARAAAGTDVMHISAESVQQVLDQLSDLNPQLAKLIPTCGVLVDSVACHDTHSAIDADTRIDILPKFAGG